MSNSPGAAVLEELLARLNGDGEIITPGGADAHGEAGAIPSPEEPGP